jgi:BD-FAE protein
MLVGSTIGIVLVKKLWLGLCAMLLLFGPGVAAELPEGVTLHQDVAYGGDPAQRIDVYLPPQPQRAPILFMVHGGGWRRGDKDNPGVVDNKVARWVPKGIIFVSVDYRMMPEGGAADSGRGRRAGACQGAGAGARLGRRSR